MQAQAILDQLKNSTHTTDTVKKIKNYLSTFSLKLDRKSTTRQCIEPILTFIGGILHQVVDFLNNSSNRAKSSAFLDIVLICVNFMDQHIVVHVRNEKILKILFHIIVWMGKNELHSSYHDVVIHFLKLFDSHCQKYEKMVPSLFSLYCLSLPISDTTPKILQSEIFLLKQIANRITNTENLAHGASDVSKILSAFFVTLNKPNWSKDMYSILAISTEQLPSNMFIYYLNYYMALRYYMNKSTNLNYLNHIISGLLENISLISLSSKLHQKILYECWKMSLYIESNSNFKLYESNAEWYLALFRQYISYDTDEFDENNNFIKNCIKILDQWYSIRECWTDKKPLITLSDNLNRAASASSLSKVIFFCQKELKLIERSSFVDRQSGVKLLEVIYGCYIGRKQYLFAFDIKCLSATAESYAESFSGEEIIEIAKKNLCEITTTDLNINTINVSLLKLKFHIFTLHNLIHDPMLFRKLDKSSELNSNNVHKNQGLDHLILNTITLTRNLLDSILDFFQSGDSGVWTPDTISSLVSDFTFFLYLIATTGLCEMAFSSLKQLDLLVSKLFCKNGIPEKLFDYIKKALMDLYVVLIFEVVQLGNSHSESAWKPSFFSELTSHNPFVGFITSGSKDSTLNSALENIMRESYEFRNKSIDSQVDYIVQMYALCNVMFYCPNTFTTSLFSDENSTKLDDKIYYSSQILIFTKKLIDCAIARWQRHPYSIGESMCEIADGEGSYFSSYYIRVYRLQFLLLSTLRMLVNSYCFEYGGYNESVFYSTIYFYVCSHINAVLRMKQLELTIKVIENWSGCLIESRKIPPLRDRCTCKECSYMYQFVFCPETNDSSCKNLFLTSFQRNIDQFDLCNVISIENLKYIVYYPLNVDPAIKINLLKSTINYQLVTRYEMDLFLMIGFHQSSNNIITQFSDDFKTLAINHGPDHKCLVNIDGLRRWYHEGLILNISNNILYKRMCYNVGCLAVSPNRCNIVEQIMTFNHSFQPSFSNLLHNQRLTKLLCGALKNSSLTLNHNDLDYHKMLKHLSIKCVPTPDLTYNTITKLLPSYWKIVSLTVKQNVIYLTEWLANGHGAYLQIELTEKSYNNLISEFTTIMKKNSESHKITDLKKWWATRVSLDTRLKDCVNFIQQDWFGCIADVLFTNNISQHTETYNMSVKSLIDKLPPEFSGCNLFVKALIIRIVIEWFIKHGNEEGSRKTSTRSQTAASKGSLGLGNESNPKFKRLINDIKRYFPTYSTSITSQLITDIINDINNFKLKNVLIEERRLHIKDNYPISLIVDETLCMLPLESMDVCLENRSILCRMPSMLSLANVLYNYYPPITINSSNAFYILNPSKDLQATEDFFKHTFESVMSSWNGVCGIVPNQNQFIEALSHDIFIYCGHGNGAVYLNEKNLRKLDIKCVIFIVGCSSARLNNNGLFDHSGMILQYLASGSPCVVGNLWDVTDKDIDKFLDTTLYHWFGEACTLPEAITLSRYTPKLKYLNGAAPVIYGIPLKACKISYPKRFPYN